MTDAILFMLPNDAETRRPSKSLRMETRFVRNFSAPRFLHRITLRSSLMAIVLIPMTAFAMPADKRTNKAADSDFARADKNHDGRVDLKEFKDAVKQILSGRDDFEARGFRSLPTGVQDQLLIDHFQKMDSGNKGYLLPDDWKEGK